jgi:hypothetical protein
VHTISIIVFCIKIEELQDIIESIADIMVVLYYLINYSFALIFVWVWISVSDIKRTQTESIWEKGAEENIWK